MDGCGVGGEMREAQSRRPHRRHTPRKRGIQYAAASPYPTTVSGILDHPPSRVMTAVWVAGSCHMLATSAHATNMHK